MEICHHLLFADDAVVHSSSAQLLFCSLWIFGRQAASRTLALVTMVTGLIDGSVSDTEQASCAGRVRPALTADLVGAPPAGLNSINFNLL